MLLSYLLLSVPSACNPTQSAFLDMILKSDVICFFVLWPLPYDLLVTVLRLFDTISLDEDVLSYWCHPLPPELL